MIALVLLGAVGILAYAQGRPASRRVAQVCLALGLTEVGATAYTALQPAAPKAPPIPPRAHVAIPGDPGGLLLPAPLFAPTASPPGTARTMLVVGDSFAFGQGVAEHEPFAALLAAQHPDLRVVNLGVPGFDAFTTLELTRDLGLAFQPDLILWTFVLNDLGGGVPPAGTTDGGTDDLIVDRTSSAATTGVHALDLALRGWRAWRMDRAITTSYRASFDPNAPDDRVRLLRQQARALAQTAAAVGVPVHVALFPLLHELDAYPFADLHDTLRGWFEEDGLAVIDLRHAFAGQDATTLWVSPRDHHPNAEAHRLAAQAIAASLPAPGPDAAHDLCAVPRPPGHPGHTVCRAPQDAAAWLNWSYYQHGIGRTERPQFIARDLLARIGATRAWTLGDEPTQQDATSFVQALRP